MSSTLLFLLGAFLLARSVVAVPTAPVIQPEDSRLNFREPEGCVPPECTVFIGINNNTEDSGYLDIFLEGEANGYVAVGFSDTANMPSTDVVVCVRDPSTGMIVALDAWNVVGPTRNNIIDPSNSQDVELWNGTFTDQRISCTVSKRIAPTDGNDLNLNANLFLLYARLQDDLSNFDPNDPALVYHGGGRNNRRVVNDVQVNPVTDESIDPSGQTLRASLTRAHGILMMVAWLLFFLSGIFFATWMKPALPNGEWFQVHRALMIASLLVALLAFMLIFIANKDNATPGLIDLSTGTARTHFAFGILITVLQLANPIISLFRCKPDHKRRWIFRMFHGSMIGRWAEGFGLANIGLGLSLFGTNFAGYSNQAALWLYVAFAIFYFILVIVLLIVVIVSWKTGAARGCGEQCNCNTGCSKCKPEKSTNPDGTELATMGGNSGKSDLGDKSDLKERKTPSKIAPLLWAFYSVLMVVLVPVVIALIVLVALPQ